MKLIKRFLVSRPDLSFYKPRGLEGSYFACYRGCAYAVEVTEGDILALRDIYCSYNVRTNFPKNVGPSVFRAACNHFKARRYFNP